MASGENLKKWIKDNGAWNKGKKMNKEYCRKMSESKKGVTPSCAGWNRGLTKQTDIRVSKMYKNGINIKCKICKDDFYIQNYKIGKTKCCSKKCSNEYLSKIMKGKMPKNIDLIKNWNATLKIKTNCLYCEKDIIISNAKLKRRENIFCSHKCYSSNMKGKQIPWLRSYKTPMGHRLGYIHSEATKQKISLKAKQMWSNKEIRDKIQKHIDERKRYTQDDILKSFLKECLTLKDIQKKWHCPRKTILNILLSNGIRYENIKKIIKERANKIIGENTKKHRPFQIFPKQDTKIELKIQSLLDRLNILFIKHYNTGIDNQYRSDIFIPSMNLIIECDGDYWHGNLNKYGNCKNLSLKQNVQRIRDFERTYKLEEDGFRVIRLWGSEIKEMDEFDLNNKLVNINGN